MLDYNSARAWCLALFLIASIFFQGFPMTRSGIVFAKDSASKDGPIKEQAKDASSSAQPESHPTPNAPAAVNITASLVDAFPDPNANGKAEPGDTITYTATISNTGTTDATGVQFNLSADNNTTLVPGSITTQPIAVNDSFNVIGNVRIQVPDGASDLLGNDCDPDPNGGACTNAGLTVTTLAGDTSAPFAGTSAQGGQVTATTGDGSFQYNPAPGFAGTDTFTYTVTDATNKTDTATVTLSVGNGTATPGTNVIWFVNSAAGVNGDGRLTSPFNCLRGPLCFDSTTTGGAADDPGDNIFLYNGSYTGGLTFLANQRMIGQGASDTLANIAGVTLPTHSDALPLTNSTPANVTITTAAAATNALNLSTGAGTTVRGVTVGNTTGAKIFGNNFGTLLVGNNTTPDVTLNGSGQALNLTTGTFGALSGFVSVTTTSSTSQGIILTGVAGTAAFGSTTVSGNTTQCILIGTTTANVNFGNTSCTGGTDGVSFQNNSSGTRTFGTLSVSGGSGSAFLHGVGGGNVDVIGAATLSSAGDAISINAPTSGNQINFNSATSATRTAAGGNGVNWAGTSGALLFVSSLTIQTNGGTGLNATGGGTVSVSTNTGIINSTPQAAPAIVANGILLNAVFASINSAGGTNGVSLTNVTGTSSFGTGALSGATGATFLVSGGSPTVTYNGNITQANNAPLVSILGHSGGSINFNTGTLSGTNGTGLQFDNADGTYNFNGTTTLAGGDAGIDILNGSSGTFNFGSNASISNPSGIAFNVSASAPVSLTHAGSITQNGNRAVSVSNAAAAGCGTQTFSGSINGSGASATGILVNNCNAGTITFSGTTKTLSTQTNPAVTLTNNTATAVINFSGGNLNLTTTSGATFTATGNGTVNITGAVNTLTAGTGTALTATNATLGMTLQSITANGGATGIVLTTTSGSLNVTGTSSGLATGTGGSISNVTTRAIHMVNASGTVSFSSMNLNINTAADGGVYIDNNGSGTLTANFTGCTFSGVTGSVSQQKALLQYESGTAASLTGNVQNCFFNGSRTYGFFATGAGTSALNITLNQCGFGTDVNTGAPVNKPGTTITNPPAIGMAMTYSSSADVAFTVTNNTFWGADGILGGPYAVTFSGASATSSASMAGSFSGNKIGKTGTTGSGCSNNCAGVGLLVGNNGTFNATLNNNDIRQVNSLGINVFLPNAGTTGTAIAHITNNTITEPDTSGAPAFQRGIAVTTGNSGGTSLNGCTEITGNNISGAWQAGNFIRITTANTTGVLTIPGLSPATGATGAQVDTYIEGLNAIGAGNCNTTVGGAINNTAGSAPCPLLFAEGGLMEAWYSSSLMSSFFFSTLSTSSGAKDVEHSIIEASSTVSPSLTQQQLNSVVTAAIQRWSATGLTSQQIATLRGVKFEIADLPGAYLGEADGNRIQVDTNAEGKGWFVDANPLSDASFGQIVSPTRLYTHPLSSPAGHVDLLTAIEHEIGHRLGLDDTYAEKDRDNIMYGYLTVGERRLPAKGQARFVSLGDSHRHFLMLEAENPGSSARVIRSGEPQSSRMFIAPPLRGDSQLRRSDISHESSRNIALLQSADSHSGWNVDKHFVPPGPGELNHVARKPSSVSRTKTADGDLIPNGAGGSVSVNIGTLAAGDSVTITFQVVVDNPYSGPPNVSVQGTVSGGNFTSVLTDDPALGGAADPTLTPIAVTNISANDATAAEPAAGSAPMLFIVALSSPAAAATSVNFATADGGATPATGGAACGGTVDYQTTAGTINFAIGEQVKTVPVNICADTSSPESSETLLLNLSGASGGTITDSQAVGTITQGNTAGAFIISELRTSGPGGLGDDFVELFNNTDVQLTVSAVDASAGFGLFKMGTDCNATPVLIATIPNGTVIPARGHYLVVGSQYSLANYGGTGAAAGNTTMTSDIESDRNVAVFSTANVANLSTATRLDAVGFNGNTGGAVCDLLREGNTVPPTSGSTTQYSFFRKQNALPIDTNDNAADFMFADPQGTFISGIPQRLGAPGPENLASPLMSGSPTIAQFKLDNSQNNGATPNFVRDTTSNPGNNSTFGTISIRRRVQNNTGGNVTRLRFRIYQISTFPSPGGGVADLRPITSSNVSVSGINDAATCSPNPAPCTLTVKGTTVEQPPAQPNGGGFNSTYTDGTVTVGTPIANGASAMLQFLFGVQTTGAFQILMVIEALPGGGGTTIAALGNTENVPTAADSTISGQILDVNGNPLPGTVVNLNGTQNRKLITGPQGNYSFDNVETSGFYTVTPSRPNYVFTPGSRSFSQVGNNTDAAFTAVANAQVSNPLDRAEYFVRQHYLDFLGREPDESGFNFWSDQILGCNSDAACVEGRRVNVSAAYFLSIEFQQTGGLVDGLYRASYGVRPRFAGFMPDTRAVAHDVVVGREGWQVKLEANKEAFVAAFVNRPAFRAAFDSLSNEDYVATLISHTGVSFTADERAALVGGLANGTQSRADVLRSIAENQRFVNAKFNEAFVMMEYFGYLRRDPDAEGFAFWLNKLNQFNGNFEQAEMVRAFIVSSEYRNRFPR